ncbi:unnamed protein product, partial [Urochloa humidicola]
MPGLDVDLNVDAPESAQLNPIDWDEIVEFDGPAHDLDYDMVWNDGVQDQARDEDVHAAVADGDGHAAADGLQDQARDEDVHAPYPDVV